MLNTHSIKNARGVMTYLRLRKLEPVDAVYAMAIAIASIAKSETSIDEITTFMRAAFRAIQKDRGTL